MTLVVRCRKCGGAIVVFSGDPVDLPVGLKLPELIVSAFDAHECRTPYQSDC